MQEGDDESNMPQSHQHLDKNETETEQIHFKVPNKRKNTDSPQIAKAIKIDIGSTHIDEDIESDSESSDSSICLSQSDFTSSGYEVEDIKLFLRATKNRRGVCVADFFPDTRKFADKVRFSMSESLFTNKEVYRLKKIVRKLSLGDNVDSGKT